MVPSQLSHVSVGPHRFTWRTFTNSERVRLRMPGRKPGEKRTRHNPRKWITAALEKAGPSGLLTSQVMKQASALAGSKIPAFSIYSALRTLKRRKQVTARRHGREFVFKLVGCNSLTRYFVDLA